MSSHNVTQQNGKVASAAAPVQDLNRHINTTALLISTTGPFDDLQCDVLPVCPTSNAIIDNRASLVWVCNARRLTELLVARRRIEHSSNFAFLLSIKIRAYHHVYIFHLVKDVETLRRITWCFVTYHYLLGLFLDPQISSVFRHPILYAKVGIGLSFFFSTKKEIIHRGFAVLQGRPDASPLPKGVITDVKALYIFSRKILSGMFRFVQSTFPEEGELCEKGSRTLRNLTVNAGNETMDKRNIQKGIARYTSTERLLQKYSEQNGARVRVAIQGVILDVWRRGNVALLSRDG